jgi:hypothetical protein
VGGAVIYNLQGLGGKPVPQPFIYQCDSIGHGGSTFLNGRASVVS